MKYLANEQFLRLLLNYIGKKFMYIRNPILVILFATLVAMLRVSAAEAPQEPSQFVLYYYQAKAVAKTPFDTTAFLSARLRAKKPAGQSTETMDPAMLAMLTELAAGEPKKVRISSSKSEANTASLELVAVDVPQSYKDMAKDCTSWNLKGEVELVKENGSWKVDKDMWTFKCKGKNGDTTQSSGLGGKEQPARGP